MLGLFFTLPVQIYRKSYGCNPGVGVDIGVCIGICIRTGFSVKVYVMGKVLSGKLSHLRCENLKFIYIMRLFMAS